MPNPRIFVTFSILALIAGGLVYLLWRSPTLWMFGWCEALGLGNHIASWRALAAQHEPPHWVLYSFPDGAWAFAGTSMMRGIWNSGTGTMKTLWISLIPVLAIGSEIGQAFEVIPGDFDFNDLVACVAAVSIAFLIQPIHTSHEIAT